MKNATTTLPMTAASRLMKNRVIAMEIKKLEKEYNGMKRCSEGVDLDWFGNIVGMLKDAVVGDVNIDVRVGCVLKLLMRGSGGDVGIVCKL